MKNRSFWFIALCMALCLIPSVGMLFFPTTQTTENKAMAAPPALITEEGSLNKAFFQDFEQYFNEHIALRNQLVYADAMVQSGLFRESNVSGVICGTDGWLYYASTLNDYLGRQILSDRALFALSNNFAIVEAYLADRNIDFVLTIPPNKNTLYGENMPYYASCIVDPAHSAQRLAPYLAEQSVTYLDLFRLFESHEETLYLRQDSHWNNKGACLAYNSIMDMLAIPHETYAQPGPSLVREEKGDLNKMLYSFYGAPEENYVYQLPQAYRYTAGEDVEDGWIITENAAGQGTLLMFRDSFGNTLIPFFSEAFRTACYSKGEPNALEPFVETYSPDCVVIEKVERNISDYLTNPPILTPPTQMLPDSFTIATTQTTFEITPCEYRADYYALGGTADPQRLQPDTRIVVCVNDVPYQAYLVGDSDYALYLKKDSFSQTTASVQVYMLSNDGCIQALSVQVALPQ